MQSGSALCSPLFAFNGISDVFLEFYPKGINESALSSCSLYMRCPPGTVLNFSFFVGKTEKGPVQAEFQNAAKGFNAFCDLGTELQEGVDSLVVGVIAKSGVKEEEEVQDITLEGWGVSE